MDRKVLVIPSNYAFNINNGFSVSDPLSMKELYNSIGRYKPLSEVDKNICMLKISVMLLITCNDKFLVKTLKDQKARPCLEIGYHSYVDAIAENNNILQSQINAITKKYIPDFRAVDFTFLGYIRDLTNPSTSTILGNVFTIDLPKEDDFIIKLFSTYNYKWYTKKELVDNYHKATSWSKIIIDKIVDQSIYELI